MESTLEGTITIPHGIAIEVPVGNVKIEMA